MKVLKIVALGVVLVGLSIGGVLAYIDAAGLPTYEANPPDIHVDVTPERVARGKKMVNLLCAGCHLDPTTRQLTGRHMEDAPPEFGRIVSANITQHPERGIGGWSDGELIYLIRTGVGRDGRYRPPYMAKLPHISDEALRSVIAFLRSDDPMVAPAAIDPGKPEPSFLTKFLCRVAFKPLPYPDAPIPEPDTSDPVAHGRYLVAALDCYGCHSADFKTVEVFDFESTPGYLGGGNPMRDLYGEVIPTANITPDAKTGIGGWSFEDFVRALRQGIRPDNTAVRYPMVPMPELTDEEVAALWAYLETVPPIENRIERPAQEARVSAEDDLGKRYYYQYWCHSCHGDDGVGIADLRGANQKYPEDQDLAAWIRNAPAFKPDTRMPTWDGVIAEDHYGWLIQYVRKLARPVVSTKAVGEQTAPPQ